MFLRSLTETVNDIVPWLTDSVNTRFAVWFKCQKDNEQSVGLQYILDSEKKKDEGFAQIGYCEFRKNNKDRKEVQIPHDNCNTGHEVQAIPNVLREEIWRSTSVAEI